MSDTNEPIPFEPTDFEQAKKQTPPLGGGGGTFGATMLSRIEDVIHGMDAADAADTGGVGNEPADLNPGPSFPHRDQ